MGRINVKGMMAAALLTLTVGNTASQEQTRYSQFDIDLNNIGAKISPTMYGIFFEDINFGADGGLYAELIKNRSFEFADRLAGWHPFGNVTISDKKPCFDKNPHYARLSYSGEITKCGLENEGFRGIGIHMDEMYDLTLHARTVKGKSIKIRVELVNSDNDIFETKQIEIEGDKWNRYSVTLTPKVTVAKARLRLTMESLGCVDLEHISLFPQKTFNDRKNGMRRDLAEALKKLNPGVFRFPGGCIVEGTTIATRYQWKNSVGPVENRPININRWNYTFPHKRFSDYYQSYGLGFYEYFLLSEDIGAEPLPVLNCGLSCQFENSGMDQHVPLKSLQPYIDDALDLIEFANGETSTKWGGLRAEMGHPKPFNLKYIAIGNEQWGEIYPERLELFVKAIRERYPEIRIIGSSGPNAEGSDFEYLWPEMRRLKVDLVDEHYYRSPEWFLNNARRYDSYDRNGPKVFAGEYACHPGNRENSFLTALCEAAFMTGLERNADIVELCTYAPLFAHLEAWQWRPDLIWFDNLSHVKTANYYVQQLYGMNAGTNVVPIKMDGDVIAGQEQLYASATIDKVSKELIIKVINTGIEVKRIRLNLQGLRDGSHKGTLTRLHSSDIEATNSLENPCRIVPSVSEIELDAKDAMITLQPLTISVYRIAL